MILGVTWYALLVATFAMMLGGIVQASVGLGFALAAIPIIALVETAFIPGPIILAGMVMVLVFAYRNRKDIDRREIGISVIGLVVGTVIGALGLWLIPPNAARPVFGFLILAAVAASLFAPPIKLTPLNLLAASAVSGISGTMVGLHGPPMGLVYQNEPPPRTRLMLSTFFIPATIIAVIALAILGRFGWRDLGLTAILTPGALLGLFAARYVARYLDRRRTRYAILAIAGISGGLLLF